MRTMWPLINGGFSLSFQITFILKVEKNHDHIFDISTSRAIDFLLEGERSEEKKKHTQLNNFLTLFSATLASLFCGSRTRACLKSAQSKKMRQDKEHH